MTKEMKEETAALKVHIQDKADHQILAGICR